VPEQVLIYGDSVRFPEMRHEVPLGVPDPFFYAERDGKRHVVSHSMELVRMGDFGFTLHPLEEFGYDDLARSGRSLDEVRDELALRICRDLGIADAVVPFWFPLQLADHLRANGVALHSDRNYFAARRRVKNDAELAGIRRAQAAAQAGMAAARDLLTRAEASDGRVLLDGDALTVERLKQAIEEQFLAHGAASDDFIVAHGPQSAIGHESGSGAIAPSEPVLIDLWPRDRESACYADMTRTFVVGEPPEELVRWHALVRESLERSLAEIRAGVVGRAVYDVGCDIFEREGYPTARTKEPGKPLEDGFFHGLGHGVGLQVHEEPNLGIVGHKELVAGDVVTVEPGLYRPGFGGCRLEDLVVVTDDGAQNLTDFPYDLTP
jgi:Xaa-Pro aminopeptidase